MTDDLEGLLVRTLADERYAVTAQPEHFRRLREEVAQRTAQRRRTRRGLLLVAAAALLATGATLVTSVLPDLRDEATVPPSGIGAAASGPAPRSLALPGDAVGLTTSAGAVWVLSRARDGSAVLERRDALTGRVTGTVTPPGGAPGGVTADRDRSVWAWAATPGRPTVLTEYDTATLRVLRTASRPAAVKAIAADDGTLWFATGSELLWLRPGADRPAVLPHTEESVEALAVDRARRVLVAASPRLVVTLDVGTGLMRSRRALGLVRPSLAVDRDVVWVAGRVPGPGVLRLDPATLATVTLLPGWDAVRPPARLAATPGVLWLADGAGLVGCASSADGGGRRRWTAPGAVVGVTGTPAGAAAVTKDALVLLPRSGCSG